MRKLRENAFRRALARASLLALTALALVGSQAVNAGEGGGSSYIPGFADTMSGFQPPPGWYAQESLYFYSGDASAVVREGRGPVSLHEYLPLQITILNQVTKAKLWGSNYSWGLLIPFTQPDLTGQIVTATGNVSRSQGISAAGDIGFIPISLGWHNGRSHQKASIAVYTPSGEYSLDNIINPSLNRWAVELDYAYTFLDPKTGREFDVAPGYTYNFRNEATDYLSGQEFHMDYAAIQHLSKLWGVGLVGYAFVQTTPDEGSGATLGDNKGRAFGLGPIATYNTEWGKTPIGITAKYYGEFDVSNRFDGHSFWLNISAAFPSLSQ